MLFRAGRGLLLPLLPLLALEILPLDLQPVLLPLKLEPLALQIELLTLQFKLLLLHLKPLTLHFELHLDLPLPVHLPGYRLLPFSGLTRTGGLRISRRRGENDDRCDDPYRRRSHHGRFPFSLGSFIFHIMSSHRADVNRLPTSP